MTSTATTQPERNNLRDFDDPKAGTWYGRHPRKANAEGIPVTLHREARAVRVLNAKGETVDSFGDTGKFWLIPAPAPRKAAKAPKLDPAQVVERRAAAYAAADQSRAAERAERRAELAAGPVPASATWVYDSATGAKVGYATAAGVVEVADLHAPEQLASAGAVEPAPITAADLQAAAYATDVEPAPVSDYRRTGLIKDMTNDELEKFYRLEKDSSALNRLRDIMYGVRKGDKRKARGPLQTLERRLSIMLRIATERGMVIDRRAQEALAAQLEPATPAPAPVVIVPCGGKKAAGLLPAGAKYVGSYHLMTRKAAAAVAERTGARVLILSARYGLLELGDLVDDYDLTMDAPGAVSAGRVAEQAAALGITDALVTVIAGKRYADVVTAVWPHAVRVLDGTNGMPAQVQRMAQVVRGEWTPAPAAAAVPALFGAELVAPDTTVVAAAGDLQRGDVLAPGSFGETYSDPVVVVSRARPVDQPGGRPRVTVMIRSLTFAGRGRYLVVWADSTVDVVGRDVCRPSDAPHPPADEAEILEGPALSWPRLITGDLLRAGDVLAPGALGPWNRTDTITVTTDPKYLDTVMGDRRFDIGYRVAGAGPETHGAISNNQYVPVLERPAALEATPSDGTSVEHPACRALSSSPAPYVVGMTDTATPKATPAQVAVITYYATGVKSKLTGRGFTNAETVCFTRGWIVDTEAFPYSTPTAAGRAAAGLPAQLEAAPAPTPAPVPATGEYVTLPAGCSLPEHGGLPADTTVVLARGKYWNSQYRDTPDPTMHIVVWNLPGSSFCRADLVDTIARLELVNPDTGLTYYGYQGPDRPASLADRVDARYGYPADSDCDGCKAAFARTTRETLPARIRYPMIAARRAARAARAEQLAGERAAAAAAKEAAAVAQLAAVAPAVEPVDLAEIVATAPGRDLVPAGCGTSRAVRPVGAPAVTVALVDPVNLHDHDVAIWNTSGGIDSTAQGVALVELAIAQDYPLERIIAVHCDLGDVEWKGAAELAEEHARALGVQFYRVANDVDLLAQVRQRRRNLDAAAAKLRGEAEALAAAGWDAFAELAAGLGAKKQAAPAWYSSQARYCTKSQKTEQVEKLMTALAKVWREAGNTRPIRILNTLGIRADESAARALKTPLGPDSATNGRRVVTRWLPIFTWNDMQVWGTVRRSGLRVHGAYLAGMSRLSCSFCVLGSRADLVTAARIRPQLADEIGDLEDEVHATFLSGTSIREISAEAAQQGPLELPAPAALADLDTAQLEPAADVEPAAPAVEQLALVGDPLALLAPAAAPAPAGDTLPAVRSPSQRPDLHTDTLPLNVDGEPAGPAGDLEQGARPARPAPASTTRARTRPARAPPAAGTPSPPRSPRTTP